MLNKILITILMLGLSAPAFCDEVQINPDSPKSYTVQKGDTLWDIAGRFLTQPWRWPEIWKGNPQIKDPNLIYPGDVISLNDEGGSPVLTVQTGESGSGGAGSSASMGGRDVRLSPEIRTEARPEAIPTIPIDAIKQFLTRPLVVRDGEMKSWPYIVSSYDQHLIAGPGNEVYVRGLKSGGNTRKYSIYRQGGAYHRDGDKNSPALGYEAIYVGDAVVESYGDPATAVITQAGREILEGDRLAPQSEKEGSSDFTPRPPSREVRGSIISVIDGVSEIGQYQVVVLDMGANEGLEVGNVLGDFQTGKVVTDHVASGGTGSSSGLMNYLGRGKASGEQVQLPPEFSGVLMVFRVFPEVSYALVMNARGALKVHDAVRNLPDYVRTASGTP